jgi:hypothetical protein
MKKLLFIMIMVAGAVTGHAQQSVDYRPLVQEGVKWVYCYDNVVNNNSEPNYELYTMEFSGTTELNGKTYHNCYHYTNPKLDPLAEVPVAWVREEGKRVYAVFNGEFTCKDAVYIGAKSLLKKSDDFETSGEYLVYDFDDVETYAANVKVKSLAVGSQDVVSLGNWQANRYNLVVAEGGAEDIAIALIEGVGVDAEWGYQGNLICPFTLLPNGHVTMTKGLSHVTDAAGNVLYKGSFYDYYTALEDVKAKVQQCCENQYYNLMGQPVAHPEAAPGIYIRDGKKVLVR